MKEQLQGKLVEILSGIQTAVGKTADFAMDQIPDIAMQYIHFSIASYSFGIVVFSLLTFFCYKMVLKLWKEDEVIVVPFIFGCVGFGTVTLANIYYLLLVTLAPKVFLIKEIASMLK